MALWHDDRRRRSQSRNHFQGQSIHLEAASNSGASTNTAGLVANASCNEGVRRLETCYRNRRNFFKSLTTNRHELTQIKPLPAARNCSYYSCLFVAAMITNHGPLVTSHRQKTGR